MKNNRPTSGDYAPFYESYVSKMSTDDIVSTLTNSFPERLHFLNALPTEKWEYRYADGKWTIKEILVHIIDAERVFSNRALRIARNDKTPLPGFDQDEYAPYMDANERSVASLMEEYTAVRQSTITLFKNFNAKMWKRDGIASGTHLTALAIAYIIAGHEEHHIRVIKEKYL
jgi:uncharacterized damage-inducible protein DinB